MDEREDDYTCTNVSDKYLEFKCSRCGYEVDDSPEDLYNSCPCCGSTIVEVSEYEKDPRDNTVTMREIDIDPECASEWMVDRYAVFDAVYRCECGETFGHVAKNRPKYCPACGAKAHSILRKVD